LARKTADGYADIPEGCLVTSGGDEVSRATACIEILALMREMERARSNHADLWNQLRNTLERIAGVQATERQPGD